MAMKESLQVIEKNLQSVLEEIKKLHAVAESLERAVGGNIAVEKAAPGKKAAGKAPRRKPRTRRVKAGPEKEKKTLKESVLDVIKGNGQGVTTSDIKRVTGFDDKQIRAVVNRAKKEGKIKSPKRGVYTSA